MADDETILIVVHFADRRAEGHAIHADSDDAFATKMG